MGYPRSCTTCQKNFIGYRINTRFCSNECKVNFFNALKRKEPSKEVACGICSKKFMTWKMGHRFCSEECRHTSFLEWQRSQPRKTDKSYLKADEAKKQPLSDIQKEIIYGSALGDGCLQLVPCNNLHVLRLCHGEKQLPYLETKIKHLGSLFQAKPHKNEISGYGGDPWYSISSISHHGITELYHFFYRNKRRHITWKTLDLLTPTSLLIWYLDDGTNIKRFGSCNIATNAYSMSEVRMMKQWFWKEHRIKATVQQKKKRSLDGKEKIFWCLYFLKEDTPKFFTLLRQSPIFHDIPDCMSYKLKYDSPTV